MSRSSLIKLIITTAVLLVPAGLSHAETIKFEKQTWKVSLVPGANVPFYPIRNDLNLDDLVKHSILGETTEPTSTLLRDEAIASLEKIATEVTQSAENAQLIIENGRATTFNPGQNGQVLDLYALRIKLHFTDDEVDLPIILSEPMVSLADTNTMGINELVAIGESDFTGSPRNRIINVNVGATKFNGLIIKPGQEFSFNEYLGDVDAEHGFLPELVIKPGGVIPEFGGGLCQVSSTAFRGAMNAGFPITARRNHSFAVQYYAPQGTDATIYPGSQDMKFVNNLSSNVLLRTKIVGKKLYFEYYGTKDDRQVSFDGPTVYDRKTNGAMKATWTRHVSLNNETTTQTFNSNYLPPALFHPVAQASTPNPESTPTPESTTPPLTPTE